MRYGLNFSFHLMSEWTDSHQCSAVTHSCVVLLSRQWMNECLMKQQAVVVLWVKCQLPPETVFFIWFDCFLSCIAAFIYFYLLSNFHKDSHGAVEEREQNDMRACVKVIIVKTSVFVFVLLDCKSGLKSCCVFQNKLLYMSVLFESV